MAENPDGTLWIDIDELSEVDVLRTRLTELGVPVTALVPDPSCDVTVEEAEWVDLYPNIVPRNGPEPGIIVQPAEIPEGHTLLLATQTMIGAPRGHEVVMVLSLIRGPAPSCLGKIISRPPPRPSDPRLRPARPPRPAPLDQLPVLSLRLVTLSALLDDAESVESIRNHGNVPPYGLALIPEVEVVEALRSLLRDETIEALLTDRMGGATVAVADPRYDEATFRTYWFRPTYRGWQLLWSNHDSVMAYWATHGPS